MKIRPVGEELSHADKRMHMTNLTVAFANFTNAPNNKSINAVWVKYGCLLMGCRNFPKIWESGVWHEASSNTQDTKNCRRQITKFSHPGLVQPRLITRNVTLWTKCSAFSNKPGGKNCNHNTLKKSVLTSKSARSEWVKPRNFVIVPDTRFEPAAFRIGNKYPDFLGVPSPLCV